MTGKLGDDQVHTQRKRKHRSDVQPSSIKDAYPRFIRDDEDDRDDDHLKKPKTNSDEHRAKQVQHELRLFKEQKHCSAILAIEESSRVSFEENPTRRCLEKLSNIDPTVCTLSNNGHSEMKVEEEEEDLAVCTPSENGHVEEDKGVYQLFGLKLETMPSFNSTLFDSQENYIEPLVNFGVYASVKSQLSSVKTAKGQASSGNQPQVVKTETSHKNGSS